MNDTAVDRVIRRQIATLDGERNRSDLVDQTNFVIASLRRDIRTMSVALRKIAGAPALGVVDLQGAIESAQAALDEVAASEKERDEWAAREGL